MDRREATALIDGLGSAAASLGEDIAERASKTEPGLAAYAAKAKRLASAGDDIARLAAAMEVVARRASAE